MPGRSGWGWGARGLLYQSFRNGGWATVCIICLPTRRGERALPTRRVRRWPLSNCAPNARILSCMLGGTLKSLRRCALSSLSCNYPSLCKSVYGLGWQSISAKCKSGSDLSATEVVVSTFIDTYSTIIYNIAYYKLCYDVKGMPAHYHAGQKRRDREKHAGAPTLGGGSASRDICSYPGLGRTRDAHASVASDRWAAGGARGTLWDAALRYAPNLSGHLGGGRGPALCPRDKPSRCGTADLQQSAQEDCPGTAPWSRAASVSWPCSL